MLKALGYNGDLLQQEVMQKQGYSVRNREEVPYVFDPAVSDTLVIKLKDTVEQKLQGGRGEGPILFLDSMYK